MRFCASWMGACCIALLVLAACDTTPQTAQQVTTEEVVATPEEVATQYVTALHNGHFAEAKNWVTPAGLAYVEALQAVMEGTDAPADATIKVGNVQCATAEQADRRRCSCQVDDGFEQFTERIVLAQTAEGWRVDHIADAGATSTTSETVEY